MFASVLDGTVALASLVGRVLLESLVGVRVKSASLTPLPFQLSIRMSGDTIRGFAQKDNLHATFSNVMNRPQNQAGM